MISASFGYLDSKPPHPIFAYIITPKEPPLFSLLHKNCYTEGYIKGYIEVECQCCTDSIDTRN